MYLQRSAALPFQALDGLQADLGAESSLLAQTQADKALAHTTLAAALDQALAHTPEGALRTRLYNTRKAFFQKNTFKWADWRELDAVLHEKATQFQNATHALAHAETEYAAAYQMAVQQAYRHLQVLVQQESFQRGLLFASHDLLAQLSAFVAADAAHFTKKHRHTAEGVLHYLTRMATKTTPLGRWATVHWVGNKKTANTDMFPWEQEAAAENRRFATAVVGETDKVAKVVPNVALIETFYDVLLQNAVFRRALSVQANPSLQERENTLQWWFFNGSEEALQQADNTPVLRFLRNNLGNGNMPFTQLLQDLAEAISPQPPAPLASADRSASGADGRGDAEKYLLNLLETGFLEWLLPESGRSPSWCGWLYQFLGFVQGGSSEAVITEAAFLLQWLRTAARTIPFQSVAEAINTQREALGQVRYYFEKYLGVVPNIPAEQLFYEDVSAPAEPLLDTENEARLQDVLGQIFDKSLWVKPDFLRQQIHTVLLANGSMRVLDVFAYLIDNERNRVGEGPAKWPIVLSDYPFGALVQMADIDGEKTFVLNAIAPDGGKFHARWLHLFGSDATEHAKSRNARLPQLYDLNWYAAFNANIHPELTGLRLHISGQSGDAQAVSVSDLEVFILPEGGIALRRASNQQRIWLADAGLEGHATRPLLVRLLLAAGQPQISKQAWPQSVPVAIGEHVRYSPRALQVGVVVFRAYWTIERPFWGDDAALSDAEFFRLMRDKLNELGVPTHCWLRVNDEKGHYVCWRNPLHVNILRRKITDAEHLVLEEMLPLPDGVAEEVSIGGR